MKSFDIDVERTVLGDLIVFESLRNDIVNIYEDDFAFNEHKNLFSIMQKLYNEQGKYDYLSISATAKDDIKQIITECTSSAVTATTYSEHKRLLKEMASVRRLKAGIEQLELNGDMCIGGLQNLLKSEQQLRLCTDLKKQNCDNSANFISQIFNKKEVLKTGFTMLDSTLGGLRKGTLFTVGARPSTGKTSFAVNVAKNIYEQGKKVIFFSLEMTASMIYERFFSNSLDIDYSSFSSKSIPPESIRKIGDILEKSKDNLFVLDDIYNAEQICNIIMEEKPDLVVVDFMQIVSTTARFNEMRHKIDYISSLFKRTAKTTDSVIMVLSQLTRSGKESPTMSDLKESGGLEQDGDYIALIHRPYTLKKDVGISPETTELLLDKNKFGATGKISMIFDLKHQRFKEVEL